MKLQKLVKLIFSIFPRLTKIPKIPTLRLHKSCIKNANQSILSPDIKSLRHRLHRKKKQPNPSSYEGVMAVQSWSKVAVML